MTDHVTAVFAVPVTVAVNNWVLPNWTVAPEGATATVTGGGGFTRVTIATAEDAGFATEVACRVTVGEAGMTAGAV